MAVRRSNVGQDGTGRYPYAEIDFTHPGNGDEYTVRITAIPPYRTQAGELHCHIDYHRQRDDKAGRYENVLLPAMEIADSGRRRHSLLRFFQTVRGQGISVRSPVFP